MSKFDAIRADDARYEADDDVRALAAVDGASGALAVRHRRRLLKLLADRERQLAEAQENYQTMLDAALAKLRAVAALRDELADGHLDLAPTRQSLRAVVHDRLDAILGGDK